MTKIKPMIKCVDFWPVHIPPEKLAAYKALIAEGQIRKPNVIYDKTTESTIVEYYSIAPHEWILDQLRERSMNA